MVKISNVNVVSYNVNGLRSTAKRRAIFNLLKNSKANIILLQETHSLDGDERTWSNEWGSKIHFNHGLNFAKGVAVLFSRHFLVQVEAVRMDNDGRFIIMDLKIEEVSFVLVNVYGPSNDDPVFYTKLFQNIDSRENDSILMASDFNTTMGEIDLFNNSGLNHLKKREVLKD